MTPGRARAAWACGMIAATALAAGAVARVAEGVGSAPEQGTSLRSANEAVSSAQASPPPRARQGREAAGARIRFAPDTVVLPGGTVVPVDAATTTAGVLQVPASVHRAGWWDGGAYAGDPFGATVLAGHVDSSRQGLGAFAELLDVEPGDQVELEGDGHRAAYRVTSVRPVDKDALAASSGAFDQVGPHRLVLITCTGTFDPVRRSYDQNRVVVAEPVGPPT